MRGIYDGSKISRGGQTGKVDGPHHCATYLHQLASAFACDHGFAKLEWGRRRLQAHFSRCCARVAWHGGWWFDHLF
eukprot:6482125-Amphidinium_carterae.1